MNAVKFVLCVVIFLAIGAALPYAVQFKLHMLGATLVTFGDIVKLWVGCVSAGFFAALFVAVKMDC